MSKPGRKPFEFKDKNDKQSFAAMQKELQRLRQENTKLHAQVKKGKGPAGE